MKTPILAILVVTAVFVLSINSCTKTVTDTVYDTTHDTVHLHDTIGPALIRFISMLPDSITGGSPVVLSFSSDPKTASFFAGNTIGGSYYPVAHDTAIQYYVFFAGRLFDSIPMPKLRPNSVNTYALFLNTKGQIYYVPPASDSTKLKTPPSGYAYLRFINGVPDYPVPVATFYLDIDTVGNSYSLYHLNGQPRPIGFTEISEYALVKAGTHKVFVSAPYSSDADFTVPFSFQDGSFYTAHVTGSHSNNTAKFLIDAE